MKIELNIDETQLKDVLDKQLAALTPEQLTDLIKECITNYLKQNDGEAIKALFIENENRGYSYGSYYGSRPTKLTEKIVEKIDFTDVADPIVAEMKEELRTNSREILEGVILKALAKSISDTNRNQSWFLEEMMDLHRQISPPHQQ